MSQPAASRPNDQRGPKAQGGRWAVRARARAQRDANMLALQKKTAGHEKNGRVQVQVKVKVIKANGNTLDNFSSLAPHNAPRGERHTFLPFN